MGPGARPSRQVADDRVRKQHDVWWWPGEDTLATIVKPAEKRSDVRAGAGYEELRPGNRFKPRIQVVEPITLAPWQAQADDIHG
jgi:hypothetical protein